MTLLPEPIGEYYWDLTLQDGTVIPIPPVGVPVVNRKMVVREPIKTTTMTIPFSDIKSFRQSSKRFSNLPLLDQAAIAFGEPVFNEDGAVKVRWVKKQVTQMEYNKYYAKGSYQKLGNEEGMVTVAFRLPLHKINLTKVQHCTNEEVKTLR